jgi:hypothetical protein
MMFYSKKLTKTPFSSLSKFSFKTKGLLAFLLTVFLYLFFVPKCLAYEASLLFSPESVSTNIGEQFDILINVDTGGEHVGGVGAKILFKNEDLKVITVKPGVIFGDYPTVAFSNEEGKIIISGVASSVNDFFSGQGIFATITFQATSPGESVIEYIFEPGSTTDSNVAVTYGSGDILARVNKVGVSVGAKGNYQVVNEIPVTQSEKLPPILNTVLELVEKVGISRESLLVFATKVFGMETDSQEVISLRESKTDISQAQPQLETNSIRSSKKPMENILLILILIVLILIPVSFLGYKFIKKKLSDKTQVVTKL